MTQVSVEEALRTMVYAFDDAVEAVYDEAQYMPDMRMNHHMALLTGALEVMIHMLSFPLNAGLEWTDAGLHSAESYLRQYDHDGIAIVYPGRKGKAKMKMMF